MNFLLIQIKYKIANIMVRHAAHLYFPRSINRRTAERSLPLVLGPDSHVVAGPNRSSHLLLNLLFATSELKVNKLIDWSKECVNKEKYDCIFYNVIRNIEYWDLLCPILQVSCE